MNRKEVGILLFENIEVLDFCGPFEVFSVTRLNEEKRREESSPFQVFLVAETKEPIVATGGMRVLPDFRLNECPGLDVLVVPGGLGTRKEMNNEPLLRWIADRSRQVETLTSVCTGALLLGRPDFSMASEPRHIGALWSGCKSCFQRSLSKRN